MAKKAGAGEGAPSGPGLQRPHKWKEEGGRGQRGAKSPKAPARSVLL